VPNTPRTEDGYEPLSTAYAIDDGTTDFQPVFGSETTTRMLATTDEELTSPRRPGRWQLIGVAILAGLLGAGLALVGFLLLDSDDPATPVANAAPVVIREQVRTEFVGGDDAGSGADAAAVARKVVPSIVHVQIGVGAGTGFAANGSGSGVVLTADGYIATNNHVVEGADDVQVIFADGRIYDAEVLGTDPTTDLAVVQIQASGLIPIEIGSANDLGIGDVAIAAGNPLGLQGGPSVTVGVISAFNREVQTGAGAGDQLYGMLQTDAPITRGSSGGALVDVEGRLIGITTAVGVSDVGVEGIGFAIPVELVQRITDELIASGSVDHSFLGISGSTNFESQADGSTASNGITVQTFESGSAAELAGLEEGDIITEINGVAVSTIEGLIVELREFPVGASIEVSVLRDDEAILLVVELGSRPETLDES
jgi:putative serine protease PepD